MTQEKVPIYHKQNLTVSEAAEYSNIGETCIRNLLRERSCPFRLRIGNKNLIKRKEFDEYISSAHYL
jgi:excisionase family DNA binding protein